MHCHLEKRKNRHCIVDTYLYVHIRKYIETRCVYSNMYSPKCMGCIYHDRKNKLSQIGGKKPITRINYTITMHSFVKNSMNLALNWRRNGLIW